MKPQQTKLAQVLQVDGGHSKPTSTKLRHTQRLTISTSSPQRPLHRRRKVMRICNRIYVIWVARTMQVARNIQESTR